MKICLLITGVVRPNVDRICKNIKNTIEILKQSENNIHVKVFPYRDSTESEIIRGLKGIPVDYKLIEPIKRQYSDEFCYSGEEKLCFVNTYRMIKSVETACSLIENFEDFDIIIRHRIDYEVKKIQIPQIIEDNVYYTAEYSGGVFDNFGMASPKTFKKIWDSNILDFQFNNKNFVNNETLLKNIIISQGFKIQLINFEIHGYQSSDEFWEGIPQWSRQDRKFSF